MCSATASVVARDWQLARDAARLARGQKSRPVRDQQLAATWRARRIDDATLAPGAALQPVEDGRRIADRGRQTDPLHIVPAELRQALQHAHQVGAAIGTG